MRRRIFVVAMVIVLASLAGCSRREVDDLPEVGNPHPVPKRVSYVEPHEFAALIGARQDDYTLGGNVMNLGPGEWMLRDASIQMDYLIFLRGSLRIEDSYWKSAMVSLLADENGTGRLTATRSTLSHGVIDGANATEMEFHETTLLNVVLHSGPWSSMEVIWDSVFIHYDEDVLDRIDAEGVLFFAGRPDSYVVLEVPAGKSLGLILRVGHDYPDLLFDVDELLLLAARSPSEHSVGGRYPLLFDVPTTGGSAKSVTLWTEPGGSIPTWLESGFALRVGPEPAAERTQVRGWMELQDWPPAGVPLRLELAPGANSTMVLTDAGSDNCVASTDRLLMGRGRWLPIDVEDPSGQEHNLTLTVATASGTEYLAFEGLSLRGNRLQLPDFSALCTVAGAEPEAVVRASLRVEDGGRLGCASWTPEAERVEVVLPPEPMGPAAEQFCDVGVVLPQTLLPA